MNGYFEEELNIPVYHEPQEFNFNIFDNIIAVNIVNPIENTTNDDWNILQNVLVKMIFS